MQKLIFLFGLIQLVGVSCAAQNQHFDTLINEGFEYNDINAFKTQNKNWSTMHLNEWNDQNQNSFAKEKPSEAYKDVEIVSTPTPREGKKCLSITFRRLDPATFTKFKADRVRLNYMRRAEMAALRSKQMTSQRIKPHVFYSFLWSIYLPTDGFTFEPKENSTKDILGQLHQVGNEATSPPLCIMVKGSKWYLLINRNDNRETEQYIDLGPVERDRWIDWQIDVVFSGGNDGSIKVLQNGKEVYSEKGKNLKKDVFTYFNIGIYKPDWWRRASVTNVRKVFYDRVMMICKDCRR